MSQHDRQPFEVLISGGGVAGLEAALALRELAGDRIATTLVCPEPEFVYRPLRVFEPFAGPLARRYPLAEIARDIGLELKQDALTRLDPERRIVVTETGQQLAYDALLLALGARSHAHFAHALTLDDRLLEDQFHGVIQDVEAGYLRDLAFVAPSQPGWPLPLYELALMTARRAWDMNTEVLITIVTPEDAPLALFGAAAAEAVARELERSGITTICSTHAEIPGPNQVLLHPGGRSLHVDRIVALPELVGPRIPGVPRRGERGLIPIDAYCRVPGLDRVFAAGDAADFAVKHGGLAAQQADVAAESIAALAGVPIEPSEFDPVIRGVLVGGEHPIYLSAHLAGGHGVSSEVSDEPGAVSSAKIVAKYLGPYLESLEHAAVR